MDVAAFFWGELNGNLEFLQYRGESWLATLYKLEEIKEDGCLFACRKKKYWYYCNK